jgi:regulator of sigma E protease
VNWIGAILAIGLLIVVHEAGHYVVARWCRMRVERFSIGFGPAITGWKSKRSGTFFQIAPIPFGGFVEIKGMNIAEEVDPDDVAAYPNRPAWQRFVTIFAGPATNYLAAIVLAMMVFSIAGIRSAESWYGVGELADGFDAAKVLEVGDRIVGIDGVPIYRVAPDGNYTDLVKYINEHQPPVDEKALPKDGTEGRKTKLTIERDGERRVVEITPKFDTWKDDDGVHHAYRIGIKSMAQYDHVHVGPIGVVGAALSYPVDKTEEIAVGLYEVITGQAKAEVKGPVGMTQMVSGAFSAGWESALELVMMLNVYLGLFNLLPLPALDGGRLVFLGYEMATRRRANPRVEATVHMVGILILAIIMVLVTFKDCVNL